MPGGGQTLAEIWSKLIEHARCLSIRWSVQTTTDTLCNTTFRTRKVVYIIHAGGREGEGRYRISVKWADTKRIVFL